MSVLISILQQLLWATAVHNMAGEFTTIGSPVTIHQKDIYAARFLVGMGIGNWSKLISLITTSRCAISPGDVWTMRVTSYNIQKTHSGIHTCIHAVACGVQSMIDTLTRTKLDSGHMFHE